MVEKTSSTPPPGGDKTHSPQGPNKKGTEEGVHYEKGKVKAEPMTWLGMQFTADQAQKLWNIIIQTVNDQISKDKDKAIKAIKKLGKSTTSDSPDDDDS